MNTDDLEYMRLALREAKKGRGRTSPNPCVGAVVVRDGRVVGRGYHRRAGAPHAEPVALQAAGKSARGATLYVTLEPCNHTGRTGPCTEAILDAGIRRVVAGMADPNPGVAGNGCEYLRRRGLEVRCGVMEDACREINLPFLKHIRTGLPWVIVKAGMSLDGRIAALGGEQTAVTGPVARGFVHRLRDRVDAILVGIDTALIDDPSLTTRLTGKRRGRDPLRVILDSSLRLPPTAAVLRQPSGAVTWIFCGPEAGVRKQRALEKAGAVVRRVAAAPGIGIDLTAVLSTLGTIPVNSLLVEGGGRVHGSFLTAGLADAMQLIVAPRFFGERGVPVAVFGDGNTSLPLAGWRFVRSRLLGRDVLLECRHN